ncbi:serine kinase [Sphingomonas sp. HMWF008]|nr:serine kinase [Sphingomonas sp. HMWF008]
MNDLAAADYALCGWRVASAIALPDLPRWTGDARAPDVTIALGAVPPMAAPVLQTPVVQIDAAGQARFGVAGVADYLVADGTRITIAPHTDCGDPAVRLFLLGSGLGYLSHQRGALPMHAASVVVDGTAICFAGASGSGKSTLSDAFARRGYAVLSDDVSPVDLNGSAPRILPSLRRIRLWADSLENGGWSTADAEQCREGLQKFSRSLHADAAPDALPPGAIFHLWQHGQGGAPRFTRLRGRDAVEEFRLQVYRWRSLVAMVGVPAAMARTAKAAAAFPLHFVLERALDYDALDALVDEIVATVRAAR